MKMPKAIADMVRANRDTSRQFANSIESLRERIDELKAEREEVNAVAIPLEKALDRIDAYFASLFRLDSFDIERFTVVGEQYRAPRLEDPIRATVMWATANAAENAKRAVRAKYEAGLKWISDEDREDRLRKIDRDILDTEMAEEALIRSGEEAGFRVLRRVDADPVAVLAFDRDLP